jgi:DNA-binding MarR family transcriptional regulator
MDNPHWLNDDEQAAWRAWLEVMRVVPAVLEEGLHSRDNLNLTDYQVLVELSESAEGRMRMTELSLSTHLSKSRLSHQVRRMEEAGLVARADCTDDRRGSFAEITDKGLATISAAAPGHVEDVRRYFIDRLTPEQIAVLGQAMAVIAEGMRPQCRAHLAQDEAEPASAAVSTAA